MLFCNSKLSAGDCVVLDPKKPSTYCREYTSSFLELAAVHVPTACPPHNAGLLGQAPSSKHS
jgi:hypothetical protein